MSMGKFRKIAVVFLVFTLLASVFGAQVLAYDEQNYVLDTSGMRIPIPVAYNAVSATGYFEGAGQLLRPTDLFITKDDRIYIVDGGNNRVISMNTDYTDARVYDNFSGETLNNPNGIYVYDNGDMLIADTGNGRVLKCDKDGNLLNILRQPDSELYDATYPFKPLKVYVNIIGQILVINTDDYHGFTVLDENNDFKSYLAQTKVGFSLKRKLIELFATEAQKEKLKQEKPPMHTNFVIDEENTIYVTTARAERAQLQRFSPSGKNIYPFKGYFGERRTDPVLYYYGKDFTEPEFVDVTVNEAGVVSIIDGNTGRIYQYDQEGNMLMVFGGTGIWRGRFTAAVAIAEDSKGNIYVLDNVQSNLHVFVPTDFTRTIHTALGLYYDARYDDAVQYWEKVLDMCPSYPMAHIGMGNAYLSNDEYKSAMWEFKQADHYGGYSEAFDEYLLETVRKFFGIVLFSAIGIAVLVVLTVAYLRRRYKLTYERESRIKWFNRRGRLRILLGCVFDPNEGFRLIRDHRNDFDIVVPLILYFMVMVARIVSLFVTHYPFRHADISEINLWYELVVIFAPIFIWVIGNYLVTTIRGGEVRLREIFSAAAYCMIPYIVITIPLSFLSLVMSLSSAGLYNGINTLMWVWVGLQFFISTMTMNSYRFFETVVNVLLSIFACVFMLVVFALLFMLGGQVVDFVTGVYENYKMYFSLQGR